MAALEAAGRPRARSSKGGARGKSGLHRAGSRVTPVRREARTSATVTMPAQAGVKRGKLEPEQDRIGGRKATFASQQVARSALGEVAQMDGRHRSAATPPRGRTRLTGP